MAALIWLLACVAGLGWLMRYQNQPGPIAQTPSLWPSDSKIARVADGTTLIMFVHPHCPCSRASLDELERVIAQSAGKLAPRIVFIRPRGAQAGWQQTDLWRTASALPGAEVLTDEEGAEAVRFAATTSGHTVLFDRQGKLLFSGGITLARGHSGDNPGHTAVVTLAKEIPSDCCLTPVFGCPLTSANPSLESR
ncbi:MAG: hypothetical protein K8T91_14525 [Planctomycetes bacterium]|nr:hypothetical protein [Planctomycetota bacterium]